MSEEEAAEEEEAVPRRDPSEKQEPHTVMWGKMPLDGDYSKKVYNFYSV